jgi:hypothetical protein
MAQTNDGIFLQYDPLVAGEIRILVIRRSKHLSSEIQCHLVHEPLQGKRPYDALSYTWGTDPPTDCVTINGSKTLVRKNLYHALRRFRRKKTEVEFGLMLYVSASLISMKETPRSVK